MALLRIAIVFAPALAVDVGDQCAAVVGKAYDRGPDLRDSDTHDASTCCAECIAEPTCLAWTYDSSSNTTKPCRLKGGDGVIWLPVDAPSAVSGRRPTPPGPTPAPPPEDSCTVGLTFSGLNGTALNNDYMWSPGDGPRFTHFDGPTHLNPNSDLRLHWGCELPARRLSAHGVSVGDPGAVCHDQDAARAHGKWVMVTGIEIMGSNVKLVALCASGCPTQGGSAWKKGVVYNMTWTLTGEVGSHGTVAATASCCTRKPDPCDNYDPAKCKAHNGFLGIETPSCIADRCCEFVPNNPDFPVGTCEINPRAVKTKCDHSSPHLSV